MSKTWASQMSARIATSCPLPQRDKQNVQLNTAGKQEESTSGFTSAQKEKAGTSPVKDQTTQQRFQGAENLLRASAIKECGNRANTTL